VNVSELPTPAVTLNVAAEAMPLTNSKASSASMER